MNGIVPVVAEPGCNPGPEVGIDERPHRLCRPGERQLVLLHRVAANSSAAKMSGRSRYG
jgi:hypothetical protein